MVENVNDANFEEEVLKSDQLVLVDFYADWCGPCKMLAPIIDELSEEYDGKVKIVKLETDANSESAQKFGIMSIPTLILFKDGDVVEQLNGMQDKEALKQKLDSLLE